MAEMDEIIQELRRSRNRMSEECGRDLHTYLEQLKTFNEQYAAQVEKCHKLRSGSARVRRSTAV
jgi:phage-related tail protein